MLTGSPVQLVNVPEAGVPRAGVVSVGLVSVLLVSVCVRRADVLRDIGRSQVPIVTNAKRRARSSDAVSCVRRRAVVKSAIAASAIYPAL